MRDLGDELVVLFVVRGRGRASGVPVERKLGTVFTVRDGKVLTARDYPSAAEAIPLLPTQTWVILGAMPRATDEVRALAEAAFAALNASDLDAFLSLMADDVQFTSMVAEAEGATFRGHEGIREWWDTVRGAFENVRWELLDLRGSDDRAVNHLRMSGTLSGVRVKQTMWQAVKLRGGKVAWWANFRTEREALEAAGLQE